MELKRFAGIIFVAYWRNVEFLVVWVEHAFVHRGNETDSRQSAWVILDEYYDNSELLVHPSAFVVNDMIFQILSIRPNHWLTGDHVSLNEFGES